ncbi:MAG: aminotransferase class V-fold PLP-dependent enzyme [Thermoguttaceae bacterium]
MISTTVETPPLEPEVFRADFPILGRWVREGVPLVYFDNAASTQRPKQVIQTIVDCYEEHYANVHRGIHQLAQESDELYDEARETVRRLINAPAAEQIIFTAGTTAGINLVARSWGDENIRPGDEILLSEMEHHSNLVPWQQLAARRGATLRHIPLTDDGLLQLDRLDELLTPRTRLVAITAVSNVLGTINPVAEIIRRAHQAGAVVLVDGAQSVPHQKTDVQALDADFLAFSGHKMLGPSGVGVLYGKRELLEAMPPFLGGGGMIRRVLPDRFEPGDLPCKFEAGTPPIVSAVGLRAAIDYLDAVGFDAIARHERRLTQRTHEVLQAVEGVRILGPAPDRKAGIIAFTLARVHAHDVAEVLDRYGIAIRAGHHCAMPLHQRYGVAATARASFYFYNTLAEVEQLGPALEQAKRIFHRKRHG